MAALRPHHHVCFAAAVPLPRFAVEERSRSILLLTRIAERRGGGGSERYQRDETEGRKAAAPSSDHHGIVSPSQRVKVPVGPSRPIRATRTASRAPSSSVSVPWKALSAVRV